MIRSDWGDETLDELYSKIWSRHGDGPELSAADFLAHHPDASMSECLDVLLTDQLLRWRCDRPRPVVDYLAEHPSLADDPEAILKLVQGEFLARLARGEAPEPDSYIGLFPDLAEQIRLQCEVDRWLTLPSPSCPSSMPITVAYPGGDPAERNDDATDAGGGPASASPFPADLDAPLPGADFELVRPLGAGGMGEVYEAVQKSLRKRVALKLIRHEALDSPSRVRRFFAEARALARLRHPHIVGVHGIGRMADGRYFLVMDLIEDGTTLAALLRQGPVPIDRAAGLVATVAEAIEHAHSRGVVHRDLKPSNVLLDAEGRPHVTDFGLAKIFDATDPDDPQTTFDRILGTPHYMAPEQADPARGPVMPRTDVYALGGLLYALLTGKPPIQGDSLGAILTRVISPEPVAPAHTLRGDVPEALERICGTCLRKDSKERYPSSAAVAGALRAWLADPHARPPAAIAAGAPGPTIKSNGDPAAGRSRSGWATDRSFKDGGRTPKTSGWASEAAHSAQSRRRAWAAGAATSSLVLLLVGVTLALLVSRGGHKFDAVARAPGSPPNTAVAANTATAPGVPPGDPAPPASSGGGAVTPTATKVAVNSFSSGAANPVGGTTASVPDRSTPPDPKELLSRLKDATVLINTKIGKKTIGNGSGFVIEVDGSRVVVATNRHVALMDLSEAPPGLIPRGTKPTLEAVFRSGTGKQEQALPAQIIAADRSGDMSNDLAFLVVQGVTNPPKPIDPFDRYEPYEGMGYIGAGFPLGGIMSQVAESRGNPSVTITRGGVSALRRDDFGHLSVLQADGSLQPGNSGGPIVDSSTGKLVGVAVAKVSVVDTIGFVVPAEHVRLALAGRVGAMFLTLQKSTTSGTADLLVKADLVDPKMQVAGVELRAAPVSKVGKLAPNADGTWPALPNTQPVQLQRNPREPSAQGRIQVALSGTGANARKVFVQAGHRDARGRVVYARPKEVFLPDQPGPIREQGAMRKIATQVMTKSLGLLGSLNDPDKDCRLDKDEWSIKVRFDIPGKLHTLSPTFLKSGTTLYHNAPMTLADVEGDFMAQVSVVGEINPGEKPPRERAAQNLGFTFQSAGLVLYQDSKNFIRLERASSIFIDDRTRVHRLLVEVVKDGQQKIKPIYLDIPEGDTQLLMVRKKNRFRFLFGPAGSHAIHTFREFALDFPAKVKVGLSASNISASPFTATFQGFALISDASQIDPYAED